jgi:DnaJ-class molecular chaperone
MELPKFLKDLGLTPHRKYTADELKKAWKAKCKVHHPDKHQGKEDLDEHEKKFVECTHAYKMLTDPAYRNTRQIEERKKKGNPHLDLHVRMQVPISFEEAFFGTDFAVNFNRVEVDEAHKPIVQKDLEVIAIIATIPPGSMQGHDYVATGKGLKKGEKVGNCILQFHPNPHPRFKVQEERHIQTTESIPLSILLKGGKIEVQTMYGIQTLSVPAGTEPGTRLKISKCGVSKRGYHYVIVQTKFPNREELAADAEWNGLDINWDVKEELDEEAEALEQEYEKARQRQGGGPGTYIFTRTTTGGF